MSRFKAFLVGLHRWLGLAGATMFLIWFVSGIFMMYTDMPYSQTSPWAFDFQPPVQAGAKALSPAQALAKAGLKEAPRRVRMNMQEGRPAWRFLPKDAKGKWATVFADNGEALAGLDAARAEKIAQSYKAWDGPLRFAVTREADQWTLYSSLFAAHAPQHRFDVAGPSGTQVYVSSVSGQVVQYTSRRERFLAYCGPIPHWIYPTFIRMHSTLWHNIVVWTSGLGSLMCLAGLMVGVWQWRWKRPASSAGSPYQERWMRWHHIFGLLFGVVALTWVFSGMMSMSPFKGLFPRKDASKDIELLSGGSLDLAKVGVAPAQAAQALSKLLTVRELELIRFDGEHFYLAYETPRKTALVSAEKAAAASYELPEPRLRTAAERLAGAEGFASWKRLEDYDNYYVSKKSNYDSRRLPVYRAKTADGSGRLYYFDPSDGSIARRLEGRGYWDRWLYNGLHSWDLPGLINRRPLWDILVGAFMLLGTFISLSSVVIAWKWLKKQGAL